MKRLLAKVLRRFFVWLYEDQIWNSDMSLEIDRLRVRIEELQDELRGL